MINRPQMTTILNQNATTGVLTDTELLLVEVVQGKRVLNSHLLPLHMREFINLLEYLWETGLNSVWVMPTTALSHTITCSALEQLSSRWVAVVHSHPSVPNKPTSALFWPKESEQRGGRRLTFVFPEHAEWGWRLSDAKSLLATVTYLDQILARPLIDGPDLVARQLLTDLTRDYPIASLRASSIDLYHLPSSDGTPIPLLKSASDLVLMRPLTRVEQRQRYLHKYTHFSLQLQACLTVQLGAGTPEYSANGRAYDGNRPGIWRVHAEQAGSVFDGKRLPSGLNGEWMSTPQIKCCHDIGYQLQVREGYYWPQSHDVLKQWATTLWQAGERLHTQPQHYRHQQARTNATSTLKRLVQIGIDIQAQEQTTGGWSRPDWYAQILARSRAVLFAHLASLVRKGSMPVLINRDSLWVVSDDPNPLTAAPGLLSPQRWRGYTAGYNVPLPLSSEVREAFRSAERADEVALALDTLAGEVLP